MNTEIWKFPLAVTNFQQVSMPVGAKILALQVQREQPCIWALVDPVALRENINVETFGTGHRIDSMEREYIGTYQLVDGNLIFHCFKLL